MSAAAWQPPEPAPVRGRLDRERGILWLPDSLGLTVKPTAPPLAVEEAKPWVRPLAAACFPLHPAGVVELHARAAAALVPVLDELGVTGEDRERIRHQCWSAACRLYSPGRSVRAALDEFVEERKYQPSLTGEDGDARVAAQRTGLLAAWAVMRAAVSWAGGGEVGQMRELAPHIWLVTQLVDALELSCTVAQTRRYGSMPVDEMEAVLARLAASRAGRRGPVPTPWSVVLNGEPAPVYLLPASPRRGWRYALESPAWLLLISADGAARPRFCIQLRSEWLLADGPLAAWRAARVWVETTLLPLVGRLATDAAVWRISRLDLAADVAGAALHANDSEMLTTRARNRKRRELPATTRERGRTFTGFELGTRGGAAYARLYLKSFQAAAQAPVREAWCRRGYDPSTHGRHVWRVEFEVRPALLRQLRVGGDPLPGDPDALLSEHLDSVWTYLAGSWLTLRDRHRQATRRERTRLAPWWESLARLRGLNGGAPAAPGLVVSRDRTRSGDRERLLKLALGAAAGIAALDGTADLASTLLALQDFAQHAGGDEAFAKRADAARARYGLPTLAAVRRRTLLPDALPELADAA